MRWESVLKTWDTKPPFVTRFKFHKGALAFLCVFSTLDKISVCKDVCVFLDVFMMELWRWNSDRCLCMYYWHWLVENEHWPTKFIVIHILLNTHLLCIPTTIPIYFLYLLVLNVSGFQPKLNVSLKALWRCCNSSWGSHNLGVSYRYDITVKPLNQREYLACAT